MTYATDMDLVEMVAGDLSVFVIQGSLESIVIVALKVNKFIQNVSQKEKV
jgi:hypothetical protein